MNVYCLDGDRLQMKGLFITFLGVSVWLISSLVAGTAVDAAMLPPLEAPDAVSVGVQPSGLVNKGVLTSVTGASAARQMLSISEDITTSVVSCFGNSITSGYPYSGTENTYPAQLQEMLDVAYGPESFQVINHGVDGYRADQVLADLQNLDWLAQDPDFALLLIGTNDLKDEAGWDPAQLPAVISQTVTEVQDIVNVVTAHTNADGAHPQIIVSAIIPTQDISETQAVSSYNSSLESNLTGMDLWITSNWDDFYDPATQTARASLMYDNFHPNEAGYLVMAEDWFEAINSLPVRAAFVASPTTGVVSLTVVLTNTSTGDYTTSLWSFGDDVTSTLNSPTHTYTIGGVYTVTLAISGTGGISTLTRTHFITTYTPVQADFAASPTAGGAPLTVVFTNTSAGDYTTSLWEFGDGVTSTLSSPTHTYPISGIYTVTLTASGPGGSDTLTRTNYITACGPPTAGFTADPTEGFFPLVVVFTNTTTTAPPGDPTLTYLWRFGDGQTSTLPSPTHTYTVAGVYTVTLVASNAAGSDTVTRTNHIVVYEPVGANFTIGLRHGVAPLTVHFTDTSSGPVSTWYWTFGDGEVSALQHPTHTYTTAGVYTVGLTVRAAGGSAMWPGGTDTLTRTRFITVYAPVQVAFVASPTTGVAPLMVAFTNASTGDYTASLWGFGDGVTSTQTSLTHTYTAGGAYTVTLTVSGPGGSGTETRIDYIIVQEEYLAYLPLTLRGGRPAYRNIASSPGLPARPAHSQSRPVACPYPTPAPLSHPPGAAESPRTPLPLRPSPTWLLPPASLLPPRIALARSRPSLACPGN